MVVSTYPQIVDAILAVIHDNGCVDTGTDTLGGQVLQTRDVVESGGFLDDSISAPSVVVSVLPRDGDLVDASGDPNLVKLDVEIFCVAPPASDGTTATRAAWTFALAVCALLRDMRAGNAYQHLDTLSLASVPIEFFARNADKCILKLNYSAECSFNS